MGEEMRVWMRAVEKVLRAELLCVSLLICGRGWEKRKEVLGVAFFLLFLHVVVVGCIVGIIERAGGDGVTKARGSQGASGRRGPARHGSDLERLAGSPGMVREGELAACDEDEDDEDNVWRDGQRCGGAAGRIEGGGRKDLVRWEDWEWTVRICARPIRSLRHITSSAWHYFSPFFLFAFFLITYIFLSSIHPVT